MLVGKQQRPSFNTIVLCSHTEPSNFSPELHQAPIPVVRIANGVGKSSQQKQTTEAYFILALKLGSVLMCLCVCDKKFELSVMGNKTGFCRFSHINCVCRMTMHTNLCVTALSPKVNLCSIYIYKN